MRALARAVLPVLLLLIAPIGSEAQPGGKKLPRVALVMSTNPVPDMLGPDPAYPPVRAFVHALRDLGYVDGQTMTLERRSAEGKTDRLPGIFAELLQLKPDVIVTAANPVARAAKQATSTIPIVMATSSDPVSYGLVSNLARPGENITGFSIVVDWEIYGKRLELLKELQRQITRVSFLVWNTKAPAPSAFNTELLRDLQPAAQRLGIALTLVDAASADDLPAALATMTRQRPDAVLVQDAAPFFFQARRIADFAASQRLPLIAPFREIADAGGLMAYGANVAHLFRRAAEYVDKILKGAKPGDLPVQQPVKYDFVVNARTARTLGLTIPPSVLVRADEVIE